jgi:hypothetical protein
MHDVAQTILTQLGGRRFLVMTGAKQLVGSETMLMFALPKTAHYVKDKINKVCITLDPNDTYTMAYYVLSARGVHVKIITIESDIYAEDLQRSFTRVTGLETHL